MLYETYKLGKNRSDKLKKRYTYEELEQLELPQLRAICKNRAIKTPTVELLNKKEELADFLYHYLGEIREIQIVSWGEEESSRLSRKLKNAEAKQTEQIVMSQNIKLYRDLNSFDEPDTKYKVTANIKLGTYALLVDEKKNILAIMTVREIKNMSVSNKEKNNYLLGVKRVCVSKGLKKGTYYNLAVLFFEEEKTEELVKTYYGMEKKQRAFSYYEVAMDEVEVKEAQLTDEVLIIDYGTSFTTAGTYGMETGQMKKIVFDSQAEELGNDSFKEWELHSQERFLCPSVIGVKKIDGNKIEFIYGREAIEAEKKQHFLGKNTIFYDTKRFVNCYKEKIKVTDFDGNRCELRGGDFVRAFLLYIIKMAEQQNKVKYQKICLTCPVKQQYLSMKMYQDVLKEYEIVTTDVIDEAVAVLYHSLQQEINAMTYQSGEERKVLILDCGGGTSDMVQCSYAVKDSQITNDLEIHVTYADGNTNFGGNNLTYRIFQYIKVQLAAYYQTGTIWKIDHFFEHVYKMFYEWIDCHGMEACYKKLEEAYEEVEFLIPTKYADYQTGSEEMFLKVRGNFYFLWQMAEQVKRKFYQKTGAVSISIGQKFYSEFQLYVRNKHGYLQLYTSCPDILLLKEEINILLKPEIYHFMKHFIEPYYDSMELYDMDRIYLAGQTLSIELFRDILKEYIPGRKARGTEINSYEKKLMCIDGAIAYHGAKRIGKIRPVITYDSPKIPYFLIVEDFHSETGEKVLIWESMVMKDVYSYISRPMETKELVLTLQDKDKKQLHQDFVRIDANEFQETGYEELMKNYPVFLQKDLDNIVSGEMKTFIYTDGKSWGYYVCSVARRTNTLCYLHPYFIPFEENQWKMNFFDGMH